MLAGIRKWRIRRLTATLANIPPHADGKLARITRKLATLSEAQWDEPITGDSKDFGRLGQCSEDWVFPCLKNALSHRQFRHSAIRGLAQLGDPRGVKPIIRAMQSDSSMAVAAAKTLNRLGQPKWREWIRGNAQDPSRLRDAGDRDADRLLRSWAKADATREKQREAKRVEKRERRQRLEAERERDAAAAQAAAMPASGTSNQEMVQILSAMMPGAAVVAFTEEAPSDLPGFPDLDPYARRIASMVTNTNPCESAGLYAREGKIQQIGREVDSKRGFKGMQYVCKRVKDMKGPGATSELTRIWNGIGQWQS